MRAEVKHDGGKCVNEIWAIAPFHLMYGAQPAWVLWIMNIQHWGKKVLKWTVKEVHWGHQQDAQINKWIPEWTQPYAHQKPTCCCKPIFCLHLDSAELRISCLKSDRVSVRSQCKIKRSRHFTVIKLKILLLLQQSDNTTPSFSLRY